MHGRKGCLRSCRAGRAHAPLPQRHRRQQRCDVHLPAGAPGQQCWRALAPQQRLNGRAVCCSPLSKIRSPPSAFPERFRAPPPVHPPITLMSCCSTYSEEYMNFSVLLFLQALASPLWQVGGGVAEGWMTARQALPLPLVSAPAQTVTAPDMSVKRVLLIEKRLVMAAYGSSGRRCTAVSRLCK